MARIAILTPDPQDHDYQGRWAEVLARDSAPLRKRGHEVEGRSWRDADDVAAFDLVMPLLTWGYPRAHNAWLERVAGWEADRLRIANLPSVLRWNSDKRYIGRLAERGAPVVPTRYVERVTERAMADAAAAFRSERLVAKPQVSASAWRTIRWSPGEPLDEGPPGAAMIQPYLSAIEAKGEVSLFYFGGRYSHAISKLPQPGDFRVQPEYDGIISRYEPAQEELAAANAVLSAVEEDLLYARVDLVSDGEGKPVLIELELIEPDLYLEHDPGEGALFAEAVAELMRG